MFIGKVLNSEASLNNYTSLSALGFIPGSAFRFVFQIIDDQLNIRHIPGPDSIVKISINNTSDGRTEFTTETFDDSGDRSIRFVDLTSAETELLNGGNVFFTIDQLGDGTLIEKGYLSNPLAKNIEGSC